MATITVTGFVTATQTVRVRTVTSLAERMLARCRQLVAETDAAILSGRTLAAYEMHQPTMVWSSGPRTMPRDGRGRLLSKRWLAAAEAYSATDLAWFRSPVSIG